jgi:hypothetical protein
MKKGNKLRGSENNRQRRRRIFLQRSDRKGELR